MLFLPFKIFVTWNLTCVQVSIVLMLCICCFNLTHLYLLKPGEWFIKICQNKSQTFIWKLSKNKTEQKPALMSLI